jgi:CheY-like chemotaxis protein
VEHLLGSSLSGLIRRQHGIQNGFKVRMATILLVDDNPLRASLRQSVLGRSHGVERATDAAAALCLVESPEFGPGLRLVITGHVLSGIPGPEFVAELRARRPEVPVLVLSQSREAELEYEGIDGVFHSQTSSAEELRTVVDELLSESGKRTA